MPRIIAFFLFSLSFCSALQGQRHFLDSTFASNGQTRFGINRNTIIGQRLFLQPDGFIVSSFVRQDTALKVSYIGMVRHNPSGSIDPVFGNSTAGVYNLRESAFSDPWIYLRRVLQLQNGKYIVVNQRSADTSYLHGVTANGDPDLTFGNNGVVKLPAYVFNPIVETPQGNIRYMSSCKNVDGIQGYGYGEMLSNGSPNPQFNNGMIRCNLQADHYVEYNATQMLPDGSLLAAGRIIKGTSSSKTFLHMVKYTPLGFPDYDFGVDGIVDLDINRPTGRYYDLEILPDGKILAAGTSDTRLVITQHRANGQLDSTGFGTNGIVFMPMANDAILGDVRDVHILPNGGFYAVGDARKGSNRAGFVAKFKAEGQPDSTWGENGFVLLDFNDLGFNPEFEKMAVLNNDKIIVLSNSQTPSNDDFIALIRINGNVSPTTWYEDLDKDGFGNPAKSAVALNAPTGYISKGGDCNDTNPSVNPDAPEICNNQIDDNCNGVTDEDTVPPIARCKTTLTVPLNSSGQATVKATDMDNGSSDACGPVRLLANDFTVSCNEIGLNLLISLLVADQNNNIAGCQSRIVVRDTEAPSLLCTEGKSVYLDNFGKGELKAEEMDSGSSDNCGVSRLQLSKTNFTCADLGNQLLTLTAFDRSNNSNTCQATVSVLDTIRPFAICPDTLWVTLASVNDVAIIPIERANRGSFDNCGITDFKLLNNTFSAASQGQNEMVFTVADAQKNAGSCKIKVFVEVKGSVGTTQPYPWTVQLSPNPTSGIVEVKWPETAPAPEHIRVFNTLGATVWESTSPKTSPVSIDMQGQAAGTYIVQLRTGAFTHTEKLVVLK
jgi:uncharacterized delta-60 repeat protein